MLLEEMFPALLTATNEFHQKTGGPWEVIVVDDGSVDEYDHQNKFPHSQLMFQLRVERSENPEEKC
jgi:glycosyltransferase involved in cell wall biosynthesis